VFRSPHEFATIGTNLAQKGIVTLRITIVANPGSRIRLDGRLTRDEVSVLEQAIRSNSNLECLEVEELRSADAEGLAALRRLREAGIAMRGLRPHLAWRIGARGG